MNDSHSYTNLAHTTAKGPEDTFHYIYSTIGTPCILVAQTDTNTKLDIEWTNFLSENETAGSITFIGGNVQYAYVVMFTRVSLQGIFHFSLFEIIKLLKCSIHVYVMIH